MVVRKVPRYVVVISYNVLGYKESRQDKNSSPGLLFASARRLSEDQTMSKRQSLFLIIIETLFYVKYISFFLFPTVSYKKLPLL